MGKEVKLIQYLDLLRNRVNREKEHVCLHDADTMLLASLACFVAVDGAWYFTSMSGRTVVESDFRVLVTHP